MIFDYKKIYVKKGCVFFRLSYYTKFQATANVTPEFLTSQEFMLVSLITGD